MTPVSSSAHYTVIRKPPQPLGPRPKSKPAQPPEPRPKSSPPQVETHQFTSLADHLNSTNENISCCAKIGRAFARLWAKIWGRNSSESSSVGRSSSFTSKYSEHTDQDEERTNLYSPEEPAEPSEIGEVERRKKQEDEKNFYQNYPGLVHHSTGSEGVFVCGES